MRSRLRHALPIATALALVLAVQDPAPAPAAAADEPLPAGVVARLGDESITRAEYAEHLVRISGVEPLRELVTQRLLERACSAEGITLDEESLERETDAMVARVAAGRHGGDEAALREELARSGYTLADLRRNFRDAKRREELEQALCRAWRVVTDEMVRARFDEEYGVGGVRVELRHLLLNRERLKGELARAGGPPSELDGAALGARLTALAAELRAELDAGADFETVARRASHDLSVHHNGGLVPDYNYRRYGPELAAAVRAQPVGVPGGPVETQAGLHLFLVESRVVTALQDVRDELVERLRAASAAPGELAALHERLWSETPVTIGRL